MKARAVRQLLQLSEDDFRVEVARGLRRLGEHVDALAASFDRAVDQGDGRSARILETFLEEEAAKFLLLIDTVRCDRSRKAERSQHLGYFSSHLARGIYARVYDINPAYYQELLDYIDWLRLSHFLDGPNDVDWIFRNQVLLEREEALYVDYVADDVDTGWVIPIRYDGMLASSSRRRAIDMVGAMRRFGFATADGLGVNADVWGSFIPEPTTRWEEMTPLIAETIQRLAAIGVVTADATADDRRLLTDAWTFPLVGADLYEKKVSLDRLRQRQERWTSV